MSKYIPHSKVAREQYTQIHRRGVIENRLSKELKEIKDLYSKSENPDEVLEALKNIGLTHTHAKNYLARLYVETVKGESK